MRTVIDLHSHILPGIDDGSTCVEESLEMLRQEKEQGVTHVVATPHFYADLDTPDAFFQRRDRAEEELRSALQDHPELPEVIVGAEVHYFRGISHSDALQKLTIGGTSAVLIEMSQAPWSESAWQELQDIYDRQGLLPIIAHVDRYITPLRSFGIPKRLSQMPVLVQINGDAFTSRGSANMALRLLKEDKVQLLGSDCHGQNYRKPNLGPVRQLIENRLGADALNRIDRYGADVLRLGKA